MFWPQQHHNRLAGAPASARGVGWCATAAMTLSLLLVVACGGIGGSGSSGLSERTAIRAARQTAACAAATDVDFCPTDTEDVAPSGEEIYTPIESGTVAECFELDETGEDLLCEFGFTFIPSDFDDTTDFLLAARLFDTDDAWVVGSESDLFEVPDDPDPLATNEAPIDPLLFGEDDVQLAFVILDNAAAPATEEELPETVAELAELGSDLVFVPEPLRTVYSPLPDEDLAIETALAQRNCVDAGVFYACPTDEEFPPTDAEPSIGLPLFFFDSEVNVVDTPPFECVVSAPNVCTFSLRFRIDGLIEYYYQAAARVMSGAEPGLWRIDAEVMDPEEDPEIPREFDVPVAVELPAGTPVDAPGFVLPVQIALLPDSIVLDPSPVVDILSLSVGFEAFITETFDLEVVSSGAAAGRRSPEPAGRRGAEEPSGNGDNQPPGVPSPRGSLNPARRDSAWARPGLAPRAGTPSHRGRRLGKSNGALP